jgi:two-component system LytT family response regulator
MTDAFESRSIDYLLKPFDRERVARSIERVRLVRRDSMEARLERRLLEFVRALRPADVAPDELLLVRSAGRIIFIQPDEIDWIDACGNYVRLHLAGTSYRVRETMDGMERRLDPRRFQRIHRSRIVNLSRIRELRHFADGHQILVLRDGSPMRLGRTYRRELRSRFSGASLPV